MECYNLYVNGRSDFYQCCGVSFEHMLENACILSVGGEMYLRNSLVRYLLILPDTSHDTACFNTWISITSLPIKDDSYTIDNKNEKSQLVISSSC